MSQNYQIWYLDEVKFYLLKDNSCFVSTKKLNELKNEKIIALELIQQTIEVIMIVSMNQIVKKILLLFLINKR